MSGAGKLRLNHADVAWRQVDGQLLLLDLRSSTYLGANETAARLWRELETGEATRDGLVAALVREYGLAEDRAASDVDAFLQACRDRGLVVDDEAGRRPC